MTRKALPWAAVLATIATLAASNIFAAALRQMSCTNRPVAPSPRNAFFHATSKCFRRLPL